MMDVNDQDQIAEWARRNTHLLDRVLGHELRESAAHIHRLESLIRWLALPYNGRTPIFAREDIYTGDPLFDAIDCEQAWHEVMGPTTPAAPGRWARCPHCLSFYVDSAS